MIIKKLYLEVRVDSVIKDTLLQQDLEIGTRGVEAEKPIKLIDMFSPF